MGFLAVASVNVDTLPVDGTIKEWWPSAVSHLSHSDSKVANSAIMLVMRSLWIERNARIFEGVSLPAPRLLEMCSAIGPCGVLVGVG
jgi:hypothetical protein